MSLSPTTTPTSPFYTNACEVCREHDGCEDLHPYYFVGAVISILGSLFVIFTYATNSTLRSHPSVLVFSRSIFDLLFALYFIIQFGLGDRLAVCIH